MMYLIGQLAIWLLLTAAFAALAGWAFAAQRAAPREEASRRERDNLLRDLLRHTSDDTGAPEQELDPDAPRRLLSIRDGRIAELERAVETARARSDELGAELASLQRRGQLSDPDLGELARLRGAELERDRTVDVVAEPVEDEAVALQAWRLRYFEQRVQYLEGQARARVAAPVNGAQVVGRPSGPPLVDDWRAREAAARAAYLEGELRTVRAPASHAETAVDQDPFAADADMDALLRWRLLYLERRVAHLQAAGPAEVSAPVFDSDRWKWRARYLEARVRHLEQRPAEQTAEQRAMPEAAPPREQSAPQRATLSRRAKPPVLASARNGAPDDLTLIDGVSQLQQTTLYSLGVFHFDQIAAWTDEQVAWVDQYLRLQGRIGEEEWLEQAAELARDGPVAARRTFEGEDA